MTVAADSKPKRTKAAARPKLSAKKGNELVGVVFGSLGVLLLLALVSYHPADPSILYQTAAPPAGTHNWIGTVGAEIAAVAFALFGLTALLLPVFLLVHAWRRFRSETIEKVFGRGLGVLLLLAATPGLLQLALGTLGWRGGTLEAGGTFGRMTYEALAARLNVPGALLLLLALVVLGSTLVVQSTLGELLARGNDRLRDVGARISMARERRRQKKDKEKSRQRVVEKHLARRAAERVADAGGAVPPPTVDLPLRVVPRSGEKEYAVRRVSAAEAAADMLEDAPAEPSPPVNLGAPARRSTASPAKKAKPQKELFTDNLPGKGGLPPVNLLQIGGSEKSYDEDELVRLGERIKSRFAEFGVEGTIEAINPGPVITVYEFQPAPGVKVSQIVNLQDDLALSLEAESVRIDRIPGRSTLGVEVPNRERSIIRLGDMLADGRFAKAPSHLTLALGRDMQGEPLYADLATMPHLLVAGATGAGKSVGLQSMITSILYRAKMDEVKFIFIDPKRIELGVYADIPHLAAEVVVEPKMAANALQRMVKEMEDRYRLLAEVHVRSIAYYNRAIRDPEVRSRLSLNNDDDGGTSVEDLKPLPYYVIIIDELADLMMVASSEVETAIARLAQMARAVGIHLIVATQRPSVDVLTGTIKANFPCRIAYATATRHDSRTILDQVGAEKLLGKGDMLFMPPGTSRIQRLHGAYVSEQETAALVRWLKKNQGKPDYDPTLLEPLETSSASGDVDGADDELYDEAVRLVVSEGMGSASFLQRRLRVGFSRASRLIDIMERDGILGPPQGSKPRDVLVSADFFDEMDYAKRGVEG
ncbi:MAG TPA: DNA translocase FtsK [Thermoanaerobaculia bacterium]|nr:DNA translocase FtsK [Thermoanaerobaculia bacterium]